MRNVCVVVGSRANYSSIKSAMRAIRAHPELNLQLVVGNFVHPCAHDFPEELAAGLTADRFRHNADCFLRLYEAEWHPGPISL